MKNSLPDIFCRIHVLPTGEGGPPCAIDGEWVPCSIRFGESLYDCRILLRESGVRELLPGGKYVVGVKLLLRENRGMFEDGVRIEFWGSRMFANGDVVGRDKIPSQAS